MFALRNRSASAARHRARLWVNSLERRVAPAVFTVINTFDIGPGSLRQAVANSNALVGADSIVFDATVFKSPMTLTLALGQLFVRDGVSITGPAARLTIDANKASRHFEIDVPGKSSQNVTITGLTLINGTFVTDAGSILNIDEALTISNCLLSNNSASTYGGAISITSKAGSLVAIDSTFTQNMASFNGGAISVLGGSNATINRCSISSNTASISGGGIYCSGTGTNATLTLANSTVSGNQANLTNSNNTNGSGGGIYLIRQLANISNCTISGNAAYRGGGISDRSTTTITLSIQNSTVAYNSATNAGGGIICVESPVIAIVKNTVVGKNLSATGPDIFGTLTGNNSLIGNSSGVTISGSGNLLNIDPQLGTLGNYGGPTQTIPLLPGSPAIDAGNNAAAAGLIGDQRGFGPRINNGTVDIGAFEVGAVSQLVVTTISDSGFPVVGKISLRQAINFANANLGPDTITFNLGGPATITLNGTQLPALYDTSGATTIAGPGAKLLTIDGKSKSRIFRIESTVTANIDGVTLTKGYVAGTGGAILNEGTLSVVNSTISGNTAFFLFSPPLLFEGNGGGIYSSSNATTFVIGSSLTGNTAGTFGGGIFGRQGKVNVINSTIDGNSAIERGGAVYCSQGLLSVTDSTLTSNRARQGAGINGNGTILLENSTIVANSASNQGGGVYGTVTGVIHATNSIIAGNQAENSGPNVFGVLATNINNLINISATAAGLGTLGNYGGPTQTIPLLPGSPAIDAGNSTIALDQRGLPRFGLPDIGAFESQGFVFSASGSGQAANINSKFASPLSVTITPINSFEPVDGGVFTFTPPAFGATAVLSAADVPVVNGKAAVTATANGESGSYEVTAKSGTFATSFTLTNMGPPNVSYAKLIGGNLSVAFANQGNNIEVFGHTGAVTVRSNSTVVGVYAVTGTITVTSGTGADTISLTVDSGLAFPNLVTINASAGDDVVNIGSSASLPGSIPNLTLNLGDGNNRLNDSGLIITSSFHINAAAGHDTIGPLVSPVGNRLSISAGNGNNTATVLNKAGSQVFYQGGSGADDVTFGGANGNNLYVFLAAGNDSFAFTPGSAINYGFIDFGADVDTYIPNGVVVGSGLTLQSL